MRIILTIAFTFIVLLATGPVFAGGGTYSLKDDYVDDPPRTEAVGCYYQRGRRYCSRYCYWEIDGRRYCHNRLRQAHPQAYFPTWEEQIAPEVRYRTRNH